jgi:cysteine-rich repeat protein
MMRHFVWHASVGLSLIFAFACKPEAVVCGNGIIEEGEVCEDGNTNNGDGCNSTCQVEAGAEICNNNTDDDGDGDVDCHDTNCNDNAACQGSGDALIGEPCSINGDCADNGCLDEPVAGFPSGYCSEGCSLAAGTCTQTQDVLCVDVGLGNGAGLCLDECNPAGNDCRSGYECVTIQSGSVCFPACNADDQCTQTNSCSAEIGFCTPSEICTGGVDDDFDDAIDCLDQDCQGTAACQGVPEVCTNGTDDDFDGGTDCSDADCADNAVCQGAGNLQTIDLGAVPSGQSRTFDVPAGALGFSILVEGDAGNRYGVGRLVKPNGTVLINNGSSNSIVQFSSEQAFTLVMPANDNAVNSVTSGQWQVTIDSQFVDSPNVKVLIRGGPFVGGLLDLKIYIPTGLLACPDPGCNNNTGALVTAANANTFDEIQGALNTYFGEFYADEGGFSQGNVQFFNLPNSAFLDISSQTELDSLYRQSSIGGPGGMHFFLVQNFSGGFPDGVAGISSGIPGAMTSANNRNSGVAVSINGDSSLDFNFTGLTMAHEGGHFMGLFHTTEFDGTPDRVSDTASCSASVIGGSNIFNCPDVVNMMFPALAAQMQKISNGQVITLRGGPLTR